MTMTRLLLLLSLGLPALAAAQVTPRPRSAPRPAPTPRPVPAPRVPEVTAPDAAEVAALRAEALAAIDFDALHERARLEGELMAERARMEANVAMDRWRWEHEFPADWPDMPELPWPTEHQALAALAPLAPLAPLPAGPRPAWSPGDQGDSLYRKARELLNAGEYRKAAASFRELATRTPGSSYAADAMYWQAFALYRIGGTAELQSAVAVLEEQRGKYPGARMQKENEALTIRIRGALAARGDAASAAQVRNAAADSMLRCDREEQMVRIEALSALTRSDAQGAVPFLQKTLARKDACSAGLRRTAVFLLGSTLRDGAAVATLGQVARGDPSVDVRAAALEWLARTPGDETLAIIEDVSRDGDERIQRTAVRALVGHSSPRARQLVRGIVDRADTPERLRLEALGAFSPDRTTADDISWMRALYARSENPRIRSRIVSTLSSVGGSDVEQWLLTLARDPETDSDTRRNALRRVGRTLPIADLVRLYDASAERPIREAVIEALASRPEGETIDKLLEIVRGGTDPQLRSRAISALTAKKDPRALKLLMEIIDK